MGMFYAPCFPTVSLPRVGASLLWDIQSPCPPPLRPWPKQSPTQNLLVLGTPAWLRLPVCGAPTFPALSDSL